MNKRWKNAIKGTAYLVAAVSIVGIAGVLKYQNQEPARDNELDVRSVGGERPDGLHPVWLTPA